MKTFLIYLLSAPSQAEIQFSLLEAESTAIAQGVVPWLVLGLAVEESQ